MMLTGLGSSPAGSCLQLTALTAADRTHVLLSTLQPVSVRALSVLSWGRNTEHQCGIEGQQALVSQPTAVLELLQQRVTAIAAGRSTSAAVLRREEVHVWGEGASGKLGLGSGQAAASPSRVEAFVGRSAIKGVALGHHHSLFLDAGGGLWAAGENKEGQCGLGTPLSELAWQHRQAWEDAMMRFGMQRWQAHRQFDSSSSSSSSNVHQQHLRSAVAAGAAAAAAGAGGQPHIAHGWGTLWGESSSSSSRHGGAAAAAEWAAQAAEASGGGGSSHSRRRSSRGSDLWGSLLGSSGSSSSQSPWGQYLMGGAHDAQQQMQALNMQPGQLHVPQRCGPSNAVGTTAHSLLMQQQQQQQGLDLSTAAEPGAAGEPASSSSDEDGGLAQEEVVGCAAGKYFSVAVTAKGEVWTFGACYDGALGSEEGSSWQPTPTRVSAPLSAAIAAHGGAVSVAAGSTFAAALTASGRVLLWGKLVMNSSGSSSGSSSMRTLAGLHGSAAAASAAAGESDTSSSSSKQGWVEVGLPQGVRVRHIAAGQQHLLMSDGERVWAVGRWMDAAGQEAGCAGAEQPAQLLSLPGQGISKLAAGLHSSAAVDGDGRLWMWGRLVDEQTAQALVQQRMVLSVGGGAGGGALDGGGSHRGVAATASALYQAADAAKKLRQLDWGWAGFGGAAPRLVDGLSGGVRDVALGGWHGLVLVD